MMMSDALILLPIMDATVVWKIFCAKALSKNLKGLMPDSDWVTL